MHYKNGREIKVGDNIIGPTQNSKGFLVCGVVVVIDANQGNCNVRLKKLESLYVHDDGAKDTTILAFIAARLMITPTQRNYSMRQMLSE